MQDPLSSFHFQLFQYKLAPESLQIQQPLVCYQVLHDVLIIESTQRLMQLGL